MKIKIFSSYLKNELVKNNHPTKYTRPGGRNNDLSTELSFILSVLLVSLRQQAVSWLYSTQSAVHQASRCEVWDSPYFLNVVLMRISAVDWWTGLCCCMMSSWEFWPVLENPETPGSHAVDTPVSDPVLVADADTEPPVVGSHHLDDGALRTLQLQPVSLTGVGRLHRPSSPCRMLSLAFHFDELFSMRC